MFKKLSVLLLVLIMTQPALAQRDADSLAYELQRKKINSLLNQRRAKFGQYDVSLTKHTGIFGLQTKKDIRRSNDILMDIVQTDNNIFKELKILLDYRTSLQERAQAQTVERENDRMSFINTINRLRRQQEELQTKLKEQEKASAHTERNYTIAIAVILVLSVTFILLAIKRKAKP
ncbi:hypothetical protein EOD41_18940 [Mucilaginibacter limnophilus]|uniref:Uncharacterized protein n=1 Tax=Mucilaginibacter limnophilus TaxID=1932778 RepID=A0A437MHY0_9SPHI|nr:hypothetical protein [Mucilaginibacter limnophilus]RVT97242.1 hypothetical protein EOD41_18940 [Mucilaginibacter limnophilus]